MSVSVGLWTFQNAPHTPPSFFFFFIPRLRLASLLSESCWFSLSPAGLSSLVKLLFFVSLLISWLSILTSTVTAECLSAFLNNSSCIWIVTHLSPCWPVPLFHSHVFSKPGSHKRWSALQGDWKGFSPNSLPKTLFFSTVDLSYTLHWGLSLPTLSY